MHGADYLSSGSMRALVSGLKQARRWDAGTCSGGCTPTNQAVLQLAGLDSFFLFMTTWSMQWQLRFAQPHGVIGDCHDLLGRHELPDRMPSQRVLDQVQ